MTWRALPEDVAESALSFGRPRRFWFVGFMTLFVACVWAVASKLDVVPLLAGLPNQGIAQAAMTCALLLIYVVVLATPFVPGAEIGLALLVIFGAVMALPVYLATVLGLSIAFAIGRFGSRRPPSRPQGGADQVPDPLAALVNTTRHRPWLQRVMRFRWLVVVTLINTPGNTVIGGGGGIAMAIGYSRTFTFSAFLACTAVAVAPVPAMLLLADVFGFSERLGDWIGELI